MPWWFPVMFLIISTLHRVMYRVNLKHQVLRLCKILLFSWTTRPFTLPGIWDLVFHNLLPHIFYKFLETAMGQLIQLTQLPEFIVLRATALPRLQPLGHEAHVQEALVPCQIDHLWGGTWEANVFPSICVCIDCVLPRNIQGCHNTPNRICKISEAYCDNHDFCITHTLIWIITEYR